jgi:hypothetical protein
MTRTVGFGSRALAFQPRRRALPLRARACALFWCALLCGLSAVGSVRAEGGLAPVVDPIDIPPEHDPLARAFDRPGDRGGFYTRVTLGALGFHSTRLGPAAWEEYEGSSLEAQGFGSGFGLDVGGMLAPWLALHATGHVGVLWNGELNLEWGIYGSSPDEVRLSSYGAAPAVTFFTPYDFFFTTAFGVGVAHTKYTGRTNTTNPGFFMNLVAGKDLYVGRNFAVGIQFQIVYLLANDDSRIDEARVRQYLFGLSFAFDSL